MMKFGLSYMGTKSDIVASLALNFPKADHFYDLFGGGGSVTHYMATNKAHWYKHFHYNEIEKCTAEFLQKAINGDFNYDRFKPEWISRQDFFSRKDTDAYVRLVWSFGNNQKDYIYGKDIEQYKKSAHMAVVFGEFDDTARKVLGFSKWPSHAKSITQRRAWWRQKVAFNFKGMGHKNLDQLQQMEQLQQLERLQSLQQLQSLQRLHITALDYRQVMIEPNSVVYCDIPYIGTAEYLRSFSHKDFFDWASTRSFPVYFSEYQCADPRFKLVYSVGKMVKMSSKGQTKERADMSREKLFWNGVK